VDVFVAVVVSGLDEILEEDEQMALWSIVTTAKSQAIRSISAPSKEKTSNRHTYLCHSFRWRAVAMSVWAVPDVPTV